MKKKNLEPPNQRRNTFHKGYTRSTWLDNDLDQKLDALMAEWNCTRAQAIRNAIRIVAGIHLTSPPTPPR